jgi:hypothetical protein
VTRPAAALACLAALAGACAEPFIPERAPAYGFADPFTGDVFRWPAARLPVRLWVDPRGAMPRLVPEGVRLWEALFLYGEFRGVTVDDTVDADVIVRWSSTVPPDVPPDPDPAVFACSGVTQFSIDAANALDDYVRVSISVNVGHSDAQIAACVARVVTHELGHVLGVLQHSPDTADLMHATPRVPGPSEGDRRTVEVLYHTEPTIAPRP